MSQALARADWRFNRIRLGLAKFDRRGEVSYHGLGLHEFRQFVESLPVELTDEQRDAAKVLALAIYGLDPLNPERYRAEHAALCRTLDAWWADVAQ